MVPRKQIVKIGALFLSQFGLLAALNFQLFGMVTAYKMMELKRNLSLAAYLSARKTYLQRKRRNLQARRVRRKRRSVWVINGRTEQRWQNMIGQDVPDWCQRKSFACLRSVSVNQQTNVNCAPFLLQIHLVSGKTKSLRMSKLTFQPRLKFRFDYMRFSGPFGRAENPSPVFRSGQDFQPGLNCATG